MSDTRLVQTASPEAGQEPICFQIRRLTKTFQTEDGQTVTALQDLSVDIPWGCSVGIIGESGSGKSTLLSLLGLLREIRPADGLTQGQITYATDGQGWNYRDQQGWAGRSQQTELRCRHFGFIFQAGHLLKHLRCQENVSLPMMLTGQDRSRSRQTARKLLEQVNLGGYDNYSPLAISGGEQQRVAVLRAVCNEPRVIFADEPTGSLDTENANRVMRCLNGWLTAPDAPPRLLLMSSHDLTRAFQNCDAFLILKQGRLYQNRLVWKSELSEPADLLRLSNQDFEAGEVSASPADSTPLLARPAPASLPRMRLADLALLAWRDLSFSKDRLTTLAGWSSIVLLGTLSMLGLGFVTGQDQAIRDKIDGPFGYMLDVGIGDSERMHGIDDALMEKFHNLRLPDGSFALENEGKSVYRWNLTSKYFWQGQLNPPQLNEYSTPGRSVQLEDPLLDQLVSVPDRPYRRFASATAREIIVTKAFFQKTNSPTDAETVLLDYANTPVPLRIVGVVEELPGTEQFLIPDGLLQQINAHRFEPAPRAHAVKLEGFPREKVDEAQQTLQLFLQQRNLELVAGEESVQIQVGRGRTLEWERLQSVAETCLDQLRQAGLIQGRDIQLREMLKEPEPVADPLYMNATLYVADRYQLAEVAYQLEDLQLMVDRRLVQFIEQFNDLIRPLWYTFVGLVAGGAVVILLNLIILMYLRVRQRQAEIGILQANGIRPRQLLGIYALEGLILGLTAALASWGLAKFVGGRIADSVAGGEQFFILTWPMSLAALALATLLCMVACVASVATLVNRQPVELIN